MTTPVVLLVTGSRSLAKSRAAEAWAQALLAQAILALPPKSVLMHGGAVGPDRWAHDIALYRPERPMAIVLYRPNGTMQRFPVSGPGKARRCEDARWDPGDPGPLARNAYMVESIRIVRDSYAPRVLALVDAGSRTHGTRYTVRLAREADIAVDCHEWHSTLPLGGVS